MHVVVNAAVSADGKLASRKRAQLVISGTADFDRVDRLRADSDAVMVGVGTVLADDPSLGLDDPDRVREREDAGKPSHPARVVTDSRARTPADASILAGDAATYVLVSKVAPDERIQTLEAAGATVITTGSQRVDLRDGLDALEDVGVERLMVEGGGELLYSLFDAGLVDDLRVYVGSLVVGGVDAPTLVDGDGFIEDFPELSLEDVTRIDDGVLLSWTVV